MHPLNGTYAKLVRARKHLKEVLSTLRRLKRGVCRILPEQETDSHGVMRFHLTPKPPPELSVAVGDVLFNIRSALDHIVFALIRSNNAEPTKKNGFPIWTKQDQWDSGYRVRLANVPDKAVTLVERLQPYPARDNPLRLLDTLYNLDKHRRLTLTTAVARDCEIVWARESGEVVAFLSLHGEPIRDGAIFGVGLNFGAMPQPMRDNVRNKFANMNVYGQASVFVALDDIGAEDPEDARLDGTLKDILNFIEKRVVPTFKPFFD